MKLVRSPKTYLILSFIILLLLVAVKYLVPHFAEDEIKKTLAEQFKSEVKIAKISFNPLGLIFHIEKFEIKGKLSFDKLDVNFDIPNFFSKKLIISKTSVDGINVSFIKKDDKILIAGIAQKQKDNSLNSSNWNYLIKEIEILNSSLIFNQNQAVEVVKANFKNLNWPNLDKSSIIFQTNLKINNADVKLDGSFKKALSNIHFNVKNFNLNLLDDLILQQNLAFGKIAGKLSSKGNIKISETKTKIESDLVLRNIFLYSKDLKLVDYFIEKFDLEKLKIIDRNDDLKIILSNLILKNLLLAPSFTEIKEEKSSIGSHIKITDIEINHNQNNKTKSALIDFANGGYFAINQYMAGKTKISDMKARNINLVEFSNSFESILNYHIESGKLSLDAKKITKDGKIDGNSLITLKQLKLDNENQFGERIENQSLIPLKTAISMIEDDNGVLELDFDISGNENDANFSLLWMLSREAGSMAVSNIISTVANRAAIEFAPLLVSSIPVSPSNLLFFANGAYKFTTKTRFSDVEFEIEEDEMTKDSKKSLIEISKFLQKNKKVTLSICPVASINEFEDEEIDNQKILSLANQRISTMKNLLNKYLDSEILEHVIFCRPTISDTNSNIAKARVSI